MHGVSASGKSHISDVMRQALPALRVRSDVERKRLLGIAPTRPAPLADAYDAEVTARTYASLLERARAIVEAGEIAIVDATFLRKAQRAPFAALARASGVAFVIVDCDAPAPVLRQRLAQRAGERSNVSDADVAVLETQLREREPLSHAEREVSLRVRPESPLDIDALRHALGRSNNR